MTLPVICSPMFIVSSPKLVVAQCANVVMGSFPALNARPQTLLDDWLSEVQEGLAARRQADPAAVVAPFAVNQIIPQSNDSPDHDLSLCGKHRVPFLLTSLRAPGDLVSGTHARGVKVFHHAIGGA